MLKKERVLDSIEHGVVFVATQQAKGGNFPSLSFANLSDFTGAIRYESTFFTSLILDSLSSVEANPQAQKIKKKAASFLLTQKSPHWSFNYWIRDSREAKEKPYPDDLDDTFCALASLFRYDFNLIDGEAMAGVVGLLTAVESEEGGPYKTWLVGEGSGKKWQDVDVAVNSNVAYFLSLADIHLPKLDAFIETSIHNDELSSPYYPSVYPIIYFISRFYKGKYIGKMKDFLLSKRHKDYSWGNPLQTALCVSALLNFGVDPSEVTKSVNWLVDLQEDGCWLPYAFCIDPAREGKTFYAGSSALTTALCLESLSKYLMNNKRENVSVSKNDHKDALYDQIVKTVKKVFEPFDSPFRKRAFSLLDRLIENDTSRQIPLMPYFFAVSLGEKGESIPRTLLIQLGVANVLGWIAYTIYDDFLDEEGDPTMLSIANTALRRVTSIFESLMPEDRGFKVFFHVIMDYMEGANSWEVGNCRVKLTSGKIDVRRFEIPDFGNYEKLAYKSLGHALGPIAILFYLGYKEDSREVVSMIGFFKHYLIAKQLNDDAHDWEKDLQMGQINPVCALLLERIYSTSIETKKEIALSVLLPRLQKMFWHEVIDQVCAAILENVSKARRSLKKCHIIAEASSLESLLIKHEKAAQQALREKDQAMTFLSFYKTE